MKLKLSHVSSAVVSASLENAHVLLALQMCSGQESAGVTMVSFVREKMDERRSFRRPSRARQRERS